MKGLIEGRNCHFVLENGDHRAGIVCRVVDPETGVVHISQFVDMVSDGYDNPVIFRGDVPYDSAEKKPGTWHFIESTP